MVLSRVVNDHLDDVVLFTRKYRGGGMCQIKENREGFHEKLNSNSNLTIFHIV